MRICPKCKQDAGHELNYKGLVCASCKENYTEVEALSMLPVCGAYQVLLSMDGTEEIASITLNTNGAHIDVDEAVALVEIFIRHTKRFIRNKIAKRSN